MPESTKKYLKFRSHCRPKFLIVGQCRTREDLTTLSTSAKDFLNV